MNKGLKIILAVGYAVTMVTAGAVVRDIEIQRDKLNYQLEQVTSKQLELQKEADALKNENTQQKQTNEDLNKKVNDLNKQLEDKKEELRKEQQKKAVSSASKIISRGGAVNYDRVLLAKLVECEAGSESMRGKIAVANVVLNRVHSKEYPNTIKGVIYQPNQFQPASMGILEGKAPSKDSLEAVDRAINGEKAVGDNVTIFWSRYLDRSHPIWRSCKIVKTIGSHYFSTSWD